MKANFQDFRWESKHFDGPCKESAYDKYQEDFETITEFFQTAVCKLPNMRSLITSSVPGKAAVFADLLAIKPIVACKGHV